MISKLNSSNPVIGTIETKIGIPFISQTEKTGNICFRDSNEVRPEFRESFNETHILSYILSVTESDNFEKIDLKTIKLTYPENEAYFWMHVQEGMDLSNSFINFPDLNKAIEKLLTPALWETI